MLLFSLECGKITSSSLKFVSWFDMKVHGFAVAVTPSPSLLLDGGGERPVCFRSALIPRFQALPGPSPDVQVFTGTRPT